MSAFQSLAPRPPASLETVHDILGSLVARYSQEEVLTTIRQIPARNAKFRPMPAWVTSALAEAYRAKGIRELYSHQASTAELVRNGKNVVVVTPTASGKTLCYNLPVLNAVLENPDTRALYLFPTKALAQDQLAELQDLAKRLDDSFGVFTYDGDTPSDARKAIRERGHIVLTNPDMLHTGILPHHTKWMRLFENLRYIVLDELHTYRGVFGSHLANVLRRLRRIAKFYGSDPQFVCCSATIANPGELASQVIEKEVEVVEDNGAPAGEKLFVFYNPPIVNRNLGIRRSYINEATRVAKEILGRKLQTIVFANSRLHTEVILTYLQQANTPKPGQPEPIRGYRGGYLPGERREIERGLRDGRILGVVATNALELGIDVGSLDACVMAGYPGSIASTWQRAGRAGRRTGSSCAVFVASSAPLDQFIVQHPDYFFGNSPEHAHIQPDNLEILVNHLKCAAFELPISPDEHFGNVDLPGLCEQLEEAGFLHQSGGDWHWIDEAYPADTISLRSVTSDNFVIIDTTGEDKGKPEVIGEVDFSAALTTVHPKAIYIHQGQQYHVQHLDFDKRKSGGLEIEQFFMREYSEERALLLALRERIAEHPVLVTFNGKSFDWPLLETRYRMSRKISLPTPRAHLDFLHPARNLWRLRLGSVRLSELERYVLGWDRGADLLSGLIPQIYFDYLRGGPPERLVPVLNHNQMDLRGLAALSTRILSLLSDAENLGQDGLELFGVSRICEKRGEHTRARNLCEKSIASILPTETDRVARRSLARIAKRQGDFNLACELWREAVGNSRHGYEAYEQLAIYYEHKARDPEQARQVVRQALDELRRAIQVGDIAPGPHREVKARFDNRLQRLERKSTRPLLEGLASSAQA